ncbi:MAG: hypothetical protein GC172_08270 [Phycisphaera sp.]|nr:hypothetical protein [Phycisphaera sp.]
MATFTDWMRLGEARMTQLATLALGAAMAWIAPEGADAANAATGERSVSGVRISIGEEGRRWTLVPTLLDGKVESFLALREDMAYGENLTAVWYRKLALADGTESWETKAFEDQDQSKAIRAVKETLALADSTDESWPVAVGAVAAAEPELMVKGVLETDALAPLVADLEDPQPLVEMLEDAGWKAAWIGPLEGGQLATAEPGVVACPQGVVLAALATTVEVAATDGLGAALGDLRWMLGVCGMLCIPTTVETEGPWSQWNCGSATYVSVGCERQNISGCTHHCMYEKRYERTQSRTVGRLHWDCTTSLRSETRTEYYVSEGSCQRSGFLPPGCEEPTISGNCPTGAPCAPFNSQGAGICTSDALACPPASGQRTTMTEWQ